MGIEQSITSRNLAENAVLERMHVRRKKGKKTIRRYRCEVTYLVVPKPKQELLQGKNGVNKENNKITGKVKKRYHCILFNCINQSKRNNRKFYF